MDYEYAKARLLNHASLLPPSMQMPDAESFCFNLWKADRERVPPAALDRLYEDILACLEAINHALNGPVPSETTANGAAQTEVQLVYAVATILDEAWEYYCRWQSGRIFGQPILEHLACINRCISCAWVGVLAGDIDSLGEHVAGEVRTGPA